ncbi:Do family serine endopeptidase [Novosphingobium sp. RD2P27]|uniref:Do family serine endopeptidase n=1 Tax=Novosphingobium kalidii TaxID=3230299 RepID=A0ABV2CX55_9SPHN
MIEKDQRFGRKVIGLGVGAALIGATAAGGAAGALAARASAEAKQLTSSEGSAAGRARFTRVALPVADMVNQVMPAVVQVQARRTAAAEDSGMGALGRLFGGGSAPQQRGPGAETMGSGFIIDSKGLVVTNAHVVAGADQLTVKLADGRNVSAKLVGQDEKTDLAVLRIEGGNFAAVKWGNSDALRVGEDVVAVGSPFGLGSTVTKGIVSSRDRSIGAGPYDEFLQIDAAINQGNSGGPLFDASGQVVGVNTAIFSPSGGNVGIGFAIPSQMARSIVAQLAAGGTVTRGQIGVNIQDVTPEVADSLGLRDAAGVLVSGIIQGSPAQRAGLRAGDILTKFGDTGLQGARDLSKLVAQARPGTVVSLLVQRGDRSISVPVRIGDSAKAATRPGFATQSPEQPPRLGVQVAPTSADLNAQAGQPANVRGVIVLGIAPGSPAAARGLQPGDILVAVNRTLIVSAETLTTALDQAAAAGRKHILLEVVRAGTGALVTVPIGSGGADSHGNN